MSVAWAGAAIVVLYVAVRLLMEARRHRRRRASRRRFMGPETGPLGERPYALTSARASACS